jgi:hypothetical protein
LVYINFQARKLGVRGEKEEFYSGNYASLSKEATKAKKRKQKKLTSREFLRLYEVLWEEGPKVKHLNPENYVDPR